MQSGDRYVFVTRAGRRVEYVIESLDGGSRGQPLVTLRNPETGRNAMVYGKWIEDGKNTPRSGHWEKAA